MWDLMSGDCVKRETRGNCLKHIEKFCRSGSIVVFHDTASAQRHLTSVLPCFIDGFVKKDYIFIAGDLEIP